MDVTTHGAQPLCGRHPAPPGGPSPGLAVPRLRLRGPGPHPSGPLTPTPVGPLTCNCNSPCTCIVKTLPLFSRPEMASRDLNVGFRGEGPGHSGRGGNTPVDAQRPACSRLRAHHSTLCSGQPPSAGKAVGCPLPLRTPQDPRGAHSRVAMAQGLNADQHPHCVPGPWPDPALQLLGIWGDRPGLQCPRGGRSRGAGGWGPSGQTVGWGGWA